MDADELGTRYRDVRVAAAELSAALDAAGSELPLDTREALRELRAVLAGQPTPGPFPRPDPRRGLITRYRVEQRPAGPPRFHRYGFAAAAAVFKERIEDSRKRTETYLHQPRELGGIAISHTRASILASLLEEFAARVSPGMAVGPIEHDGAFTDFLVELTDWLYDHTPL